MKKGSVLIKKTKDKISELLNKIKPLKTIHESISEADFVNISINNFKVQGKDLESFDKVLNNYICLVINDQIINPSEEIKDNPTLINKNEENENLQSQIKALIQEKTNLNTQIEALIQQRNSFEAVISNHDEEKKRLIDQINSLNNEFYQNLGNHEDEKKNLNDQIKTLNQKNANLNAQIITLTQENTNFNDQIKTLNEAKTSLNNEIDTLYSQFDQNLSNHEDEINKLNQTIKKLESPNSPSERSSKILYKFEINPPLDFSRVSQIFYFFSIDVEPNVSIITNAFVTNDKKYVFYCKL